MNGKDIHDAVEFVGHDLVDLAEKQRFARPLWRTVLPAAAMLAVMLGLSTAAMRYVQTPTPSLSSPPEVSAIEEAEQPPEEIPVQEEPEIITEAHPLQTAFPQLDTDTLDAYVDAHPEVLENGWDKLYINQAGLDDQGTDIYTTQGDQVLAIDAKNGILLIRVRGDGYQGVLAVANDPTRLSLQASSQLGTAGETVGEIAETHNGILAMTASGSISDGNGGILLGYAICDGTAYNEEDLFHKGQARLEINSHGLFSIISPAGPLGEDVQNAVQFVPSLIIDGQITDGLADWYGSSPRSCVGQTEDGTVLMLVIEGRLPERSNGTGLAECAAILSCYGAVQAMNLDGGTSSILWYDGEYVTKCSDQALPEGRFLPNAFVVERAQ